MRKLAQGTSGKGASTTSRQVLVSASCFKRHHADAGIVLSDATGNPHRSSMMKGTLPSRTRRSAALRSSGTLRQRTHRSREQDAEVWEAGSKVSPPSTSTNFGNSAASSGSASRPAIHSESPPPCPVGTISEMAPAGKEEISNGRPDGSLEASGKIACPCACGNFSRSCRRRSSIVGGVTPGI